jgi:hypothetical protein
LNSSFKSRAVLVFVLGGGAFTRSIMLACGLHTYSCWGVNIGVGSGVLVGIGCDVRSNATASHPGGGILIGTSVAGGTTFVCSVSPMNKFCGGGGLGGTTQGGRILWRTEQAAASAGPAEVMVVSAAEVPVTADEPAGATATAVEPTEAMVAAVELAEAGGGCGSAPWAAVGSGVLQ